MNGKIFITTEQAKTEMTLEHGTAAEIQQKTIELKAYAGVNQYSAFEVYCILPSKMNDINFSKEVFS